MNQAEIEELTGKIALILETHIADIFGYNQDVDFNLVVVCSKQPELEFVVHASELSEIERVIENSRKWQPVASSIRRNPPRIASETGNE